MDEKTAQTEKLMMDFAAQLTQSWVETLSCMFGNASSDDQKMVNRMLLQVRDSDLSRVDAIERKLGISPTTAQIRRWYKSSRHGNDFEDWIRERS